MVAGVVGRPKTQRRKFVVETLTEVAEFFGVSLPAVTAWKSEDEPMPQESNGYDLSKIAQWLRRKRDGRSTLSDEVKQADIRLKTVKAQQEELDLEIRRGGLVELAEVERWAATALIEARETIMALPEHIATSSPQELRNTARNEAERCCRNVLTMLRRRLETENLEQGDKQE